MRMAQPLWNQAIAALAEISDGTAGGGVRSVMASVSFNEMAMTLYSLILSTSSCVSRSFVRS